MRSILIRWRYWLWLIERDFSDEACAFFWVLLNGESMSNNPKITDAIDTFLRGLADNGMIDKIDLIRVFVPPKQSIDITRDEISEIAKKLVYERLRYERPRKPTDDIPPAP
jgi:hypothetical protein